MADTLALKFEAATSGTFQSRVEIALVSAAVAIQAENPDKANRGNRRALSRSCLVESNKYVRAFSLAVASAGIDESSADADIAAAINSVWDAIAGGP